MIGPDMQVIYDLGANTGDNIAYYLLKAERVVAVEANPNLAKMITARYSSEILSGRLVVENAVLVNDKGGQCVPFYINTRNHRMSRFPEPIPPLEYGSDPSHYEKATLPSLDICKLVERCGPADYMKIDLEYYDMAILKAMFANGIFPSRLSVESQDIAIFLTLVSLGGYNSFKLVDGSQVGRDFANHPIMTSAGPAVFQFPHHSAGPCADDLPGAWQNADSFFRHLALHGIGWRDIHASRIDAPITARRQSLLDYVVEERIPPVLRGVARTVLSLASRLTAKKWPEFELSVHRNQAA